jgi:exonuclease VII large subunit
MENLTPKTENTYESVWASFREHERLIEKSREESEQRAKESDKQLQELKQLMKETDQQIKETGQQIKETGQQMKETDRQFKEMKNLLGSWANNHGSFAEEYFFNSFENGKQNFFGEHFNEIRKKVKNKGMKIEDEYDIVLYNNTAVAIVEVKYKAHENDIPKVLNKVKTFRILCPDYKDFNIFLGLASMSFYPELEQECINQGIAIIKQVGETVIINDKHLKVF